jgi:sterol desaturase/sphingolipid hydroxylase (fatty acid hydroxylase superfamily)
VNYQVSPMDFIDVDYMDSLGFHVCMHLPIAFIPLYSLEYISWYFIMMNCGFFLHSNLLGEHHILHHKYFHYNYCFLIPIFDYAFGTYR